LAETLGMSRTPIRTSLVRLDFEGLANYVPNKGLSVADISLSKTVELYDYRIAMETFVARKLSPMIWDKEDIQWFGENLREQEAFVAAEDHAGFTQADMQFHLKLAEVYGNAEIVQAMRQLQNRLYQIALRVLRKDRARIKVSYDDHVRIFEAVHTGKELDAVKQMEEHLEFGKRILVM
jgi:DNA-binding GntR family transcriptional regulator